MCFLSLYIHNTNKFCYNAIIEESSTRVGLISSYPIGGGGTMKKFFRKINVLILILKLIVQIISFFNN